MNTPSSAPLVSTTLEEAREKMISEGTSIIDRATRERELREVFGNPHPLLDQLGKAFQKSPLITVTSVFLIGTVIGSRLAKSGARF